jgi:hypothetical protein
MLHQGTMKAYSVDLRKKIVEAVEQRGMRKASSTRKTLTDYRPKSATQLELS